MKLYDVASIPPEQMNQYLTRQVMHGDSVTISRLSLSAGAVVPRHSHPNEQVTMVVSGRLRFLFPDGEVTVESGQWLQIASEEPHGVEALEDSVALDVFAPRREDWIRGDDAYLRKG
jgi:quercetin dioxygenase-like cupin family protein